MLAREQYIGAAVLLVTAAAVWTFVALAPQRPLPESAEAGRDSLRTVRDSLRRDSIRQAREARWQHYKDSCRKADDARFAAWNAERKARYDSFFRADSLWRDSLGIIFPRHVKKDTILDLNSADTTELMYIRGIGPYTARQIIRYREQLGGFYSPNQLTDEALARLHLDTLTACFVADPKDIQTIDVNHCSIERLAHHPYIRYEQARAIYQLRRRNLRLNGMEDLRGVSGLDSVEIERLRYYLRFE